MPNIVSSRIQKIIKLYPESTSSYQKIPIKPGYQRNTVSRNTYVRWPIGSALLNIRQTLCYGRQKQISLGLAAIANPKIFTITQRYWIISKKVLKTWSWPLNFLPYVGGIETFVNEACLEIKDGVETKIEIPRWKERNYKKVGRA